MVSWQLLAEQRVADRHLRSIAGPTEWEHGSAKHHYAAGEGSPAADMGGFFETLADWQWFVTITCDPKKLDKGFTQAGEGWARGALLSVLEYSACGAFVAVFERQSRGDFHVHALLARCESINGRRAEATFAESFGMAKWKIFQGSGAGSYLAKYMAKEMVSTYVGLQGPYNVPCEHVLRKRGVLGQCYECRKQLLSRVRL